jgi:hypothetical protein
VLEFWDALVPALAAVPPTGAAVGEVRTQMLRKWAACDGGTAAPSRHTHAGQRCDGHTPDGEHSMQWPHRTHMQHALVVNSCA